MTSILNQDVVNHAMLHHGVVMAIKNYVTMKDTSVQTYRQSLPPRQLSTSTAAALASRLGTGRARKAQQRP